MCTVTYIPSEKGVHITSNRDERYDRGAALEPEKYGDVNGRRLLYPIDIEGGGSWIVLKDNGDAAVLLNGAMVPHTRNLSYRRSRGLVLLELAQAVNPLFCFTGMDLCEIEPFTLILYSGGQLMKCWWDGITRQNQTVNPAKPHIWSSVTLYDQPARENRERWFAEWQRSWGSQTPSGEEILRFHRQTGVEDSFNGMVINRENKMLTVSITSVYISGSEASMAYHNLKTGQESKQSFQKKNSEAESRPARLYRALRSMSIRLFHWEYWPFHVVYGPIYVYWLWLSLKARSLFFFSAANPGIENAGWLMEKKSDIYPLIPERYYPKTLLCLPGDTNLRERIWINGFRYPFIAKPDVGQRGVLVNLLKSDQELFEYHNQMQAPFLVQEFVDYELEAGIFYYRIPGEHEGHISGIVGKTFLTVEGDGCATIEELLKKNNRYFLQLAVLKQTYGALLSTVLPKGVSQLLVPYGNHSRGSRFNDLSYLINERLTAVIDQVCRQMPGFYFGRLDIKFKSWEDLEAGEHFSIIEVNGAGSEPTHIYDPSHSIFFAWKEICRHWMLLYQISLLNSERKKLPLMTFAEGMNLLRRNFEYLREINS